MTFVSGFAVVSNSRERIYFVGSCRQNALFYGYLQFQEAGFDVDGGLQHDVPQMIMWTCDYLGLQSNGLGPQVLFSLSSVIACAYSLSAV